MSTLASLVSGLGLAPVTSNGKRPDYADSIGSTDTSSTSDSAFTESVAGAAGPNANPRLALVMASLVRHLHAFAREVDLTHDEWMAGVDFINRAGLLSPTRNETQLLCDIIGLESLVDHITNNRKAETEPDATTSPDSPTSSAILGPFYKDSPPARLAGESIASARSNQAHATETTRAQGQVLCAATGTPITDAVVDIWHANPDGEYEGQGRSGSSLESGELRGVFKTDVGGNYDIYCLRPGPYPLPDDGPVGDLLRLLDRPVWRPAHLHFKVSAPGFRSLTTQLFDGSDPHLRADTVFAVKDDLKIEFQPIDTDPRASFAVNYDFRLTPVDSVVHT
jgi:catechol 1,2-dioxygenase